MASGLSSGTPTPDQPTPVGDWPAISCESRPWTRWWWMGSAVDRKNLLRELDRLQQAGIGGVEITAIYGVKGEERRFIPYLSREWLDMIALVAEEAGTRGMGVDLPTGSGWRTGGPFLPSALGSASLRLQDHPVAGGQTFTATLGERMAAVVAIGPEGQAVPLNESLGERGALSWDVAPGEWTLWTAEVVPTEEKVKRPGPGGEGYAFNPLSRESLDAVVRHFDQAWVNWPRGMIRAQFHDSWEYTGDASDDLWDLFIDLHGYDLRDNIHRLAGVGDADECERVLCDLRSAVSELASRFVERWTDWAHSRGELTRNQAHGTPGNLLDAYAAADIPETEIFRHPTEWTPLLSKFASSAAHVMRKRLVSSETCTWLGEHFTVTLGQAKQSIDTLFVAGINHIVYHGTAYSPDGADWPGWVFYASTQFNPRNSIWADVDVLNSYVARCQAVLQSGQPVHDILLYWPFHDAIMGKGRGLRKQLTIEGEGWFVDTAFGRFARGLWEAGYAFDYVSDRMLANATPEKGHIRVPGGYYKAVVVPPCTHMPPETVYSLVRLADRGIPVIAVGLPKDVPGLARLDVRRARLTDVVRWLQDALGTLLVADSATDHEGVSTALAITLTSAGIAPVSPTGSGLRILQRQDGDRLYCLVLNEADTAFDGWIALGLPGAPVAIMDPMTGATGLAATRARNGTREAYLQLRPGQSLLLQADTNMEDTGSMWSYWRPAGDATVLSGTWKVSFVAGGPSLPKTLKTDTLTSWTEFGVRHVERFAGTARYELRFDAPDQHDGAWELDLGEVCYSARVRLNGHEIGALIDAPYTIVLPSLAPKDNRLEIDVTSTAANRVRDLDRRGVNWKRFHDINIVNIDYKPFDAADWPVVPAGLLGPVSLRPVEALEPERSA